MWERRFLQVRGYLWAACRRARTHPPVAEEAAGHSAMSGMPPDRYAPMPPASQRYALLRHQVPRSLPMYCGGEGLHVAGKAHVRSRLRRESTATSLDAVDRWHSGVDGSTPANHRFSEKTNAGCARGNRHLLVGCCCRSGDGRTCRGLLVVVVGFLFVAPLDALTRGAGGSTARSGL